MKINKTDLQTAASKVALSPAQTEALWQALQAQAQPETSQALSRLAYYLGALILFSAMGWFLTEAWSAFGSGGLLLIVSLYMLSLAVMGGILFFQQQQALAGGILFTVAVSMTPLLLYAVQDLAGVWLHTPSDVYSGWLHGNWLILYSGTLLVSLLVLLWLRFALLLLPLGFSLWWLCLDGTAWWLGVPEISWGLKLWISCGFGGLWLLLALALDYLTYRQFALLSYLLGLCACWGSLSALHLNNDIPQWLYLLFNLGLMLSGVLLQRNILLIVGAIGVLGYLGYLIYAVFADSVLFPFILTGFGLLVIITGVAYQHYAQSSIQS